jgi:Ribonuclease G/E
MSRAGRIIAVERSAAGFSRAALVIDGRLEDLLLDGPGDQVAPESIHLGRVDRVVPGLGAAFLRLADGTQGWLRAPGLRPGAMALVQVTRWADPGKAVPVTDRLLYKGRLAILTPGAPGANIARGIRGHEARARLAALGERALDGIGAHTGLVLRTAAAAADDDDILAEIAALRDVAAETDAAAAAGGAPRLLLGAPDAAARAFRDWADPAPDTVIEDDDAFERLGLWDAIAALERPEVPLSGGGFMLVEATRALVGVDVNTGDNFGKGAPAAANLAACAELMRQLRLRGLGGAVIVDFAPVKKGARQGIDKALGQAAAADPVETQLGGWTPMGRYEMTRKRERRPLAEVIDAHR